MQKCVKYHSAAGAKKMNVVPVHIIEVRALQHRFVAKMAKWQNSEFLCQFPTQTGLT